MITPIDGSFAPDYSAALERVSVCVRKAIEAKDEGDIITMLNYLLDAQLEAGGLIFLLKPWYRTEFFNHEGGKQ